MHKHENFSRYLKCVQPGSVFVEIGGERGEGSTAHLCNLAKSFSVRLISVDLKSLLAKKQDLLLDIWSTFYRNVRDPEWPEKVADLQDLPTSIQKECLEVHRWLDCKNAALDNFGFSDNLIDITQSGSSWSANYGENHNDPISLLYLDNFDYIWNEKNPQEFIKKQIIQYWDDFKIEMNNENCQIEHLTQLINLYPFLTKDCLVGLDDTYKLNGCWVGKSGPGVVFLLSQGWEIIFKDDTFVMMRRACRTDSP